MENEREARLIALKVELLREKDLCCCCLATALYHLNIALDMSWDSIAASIDGISDKSLAHRIARRQRNVSKGVYDLATASINKLLSDKGLEQIDFPIFP